MVAGVVTLCAIGCIERTISINTEPQGATVILNDQEVGKSPVKANFTWYGNYDIIIRKPGFKTIQTSHRTKTPWHQYPIIDIFTECLMPFTIHDDHVLETYVMEPREKLTKEQLLQGAGSMREEAQATR